MARHFDQSNNDYLDAGNPSALNLTGNEITLSARIKIEVLDGEQKIIAKWGDAGGERHQYLLSVTSADNIQFVINASGQVVVIGTTTLVAGVWYHVMGTYDGSNARVYLEGVEENSALTSANMSSTTAPVVIGAGSADAGSEEPFDGDIGHCAIWGAGLSASEIESLANNISPLNIRAESILFYAPLNGQNPEYDIVGGINLTVNGTTVAEEPPIPNSIKAP